MIAALLICFLTPLIAARVAARPRFSWVDPVIVCYLVGLAFAHLPLGLPADTLTAVTEATIPLAIPLLLFNTDIRQWLKGSRKTILGFVVAIVSVLIAIPTAAQLFGTIQDLPLIAGMMTGSWTGGTPNLMSVGHALNAPKALVVVTNSADVFVGGIYLGLLLLAAPLLRRLHGAPEEIVPLDAVEPTTRDGAWFKDAAVSVVLAVLVTGASAGISLALFGALSAPAVILGITTGGVLLSFVDKIRNLATSFEIGNYLILVFCVAIGCLTNVTALLEAGLDVLMFAAVGILGTLTIHYSVCRLLRIDADTTIITSVSTIMGPPLVIPVARRLNNRNALVSGVTSGLVGYSLANYLGIAMAALLS